MSALVALVAALTPVSAKAEDALMVPEPGGPAGSGSVAGAGGSTPSKSIFLKRLLSFDGKSWLMSIHASDMQYGDYVSVSFAKTTTKKKKDGKLVYQLRESQSYGFGADVNTVDIKDDLTGSIDLGDQFPGQFDADIDFVAIPKKGIKKLCDGNIKTRVVKTTKNSSMSLDTDNSLFGTVDQVPSKGKVTTSNGKCKSGHGGCPSPSKSVSGYGFMADNSYVGWAGTTPNAGKYGTINLWAQSYDGSGASWFGSLGGKVLKSRITVANDLSEGEIDVGGLPKLSGTANAAAAGPATTGQWVKCGKDKRYRSNYRGGTQGGDLTWTPSGMGPVSVDQDFESEYGTLSKMQVANR